MKCRKKCLVPLEACGRFVMLHPRLRILMGDPDEKIATWLMSGHIHGKKWSKNIHIARGKGTTRMQISTYFSCILSAIVFSKYITVPNHTSLWKSISRNVATDVNTEHHIVKVMVKVVVYSLNIHNYAYSTDFTFRLERWVPMQPAPIDPTLDLCTKYLLQLGGPRRCEIWSCPTLLHTTSTVNRTPNIFWSWA